MNTKKKKSANVFISYALSFLLSLLLVLIALVGVVAVTVCNPAFFKTQVLQSGFTTTVLSELQENYQSYGSAGGFAPEVMKSFITQDQVQQNMFTCVERFYAGERDALEYPELVQKAYDSLAADLTARDITITPEIEAGVKKLATACAQDYQSYIQVPFASYLIPLMQKVNQGVLWSVIFLICSSVATLFLLLYLQRTRRAKLQYTTHAFTTAILFCIAVPMFTKLTVQMDRLNVNPVSIRFLAAEYVDSMLAAFFYFACIYAVVVIALALTSWVDYRKYCRFYKQRKDEEA